MDSVTAKVSKVAVLGSLFFAVYINDLSKQMSLLNR